MSSPLVPQKLQIEDIATCLRQGYRLFAASRGAAIAYSLLLLLIGIVQMGVVVWLGALPMLYALISGFMLVGAVASAGLMALAIKLEQGQPPSLADAWKGFVAAPGLWVLSALAAFLWLIWVTDAGILYGLYFASEPVRFLPRFGFSGEAPAFFLFSALMGAVPAAIMLAVATFSVPLLLERRCTLAQAIVLSVRASLRNPIFMLLWGVMVCLGVSLSIAFLPLFLLVFPVLAYASFACYRCVYPR